MSAQFNPGKQFPACVITAEAQITLLNVVVSEQEINLQASGVIIHTLCERLTSQQKEIDRLTRAQRTRASLEAIARQQGG